MIAPGFLRPFSVRLTAMSNLSYGRNSYSAFFAGSQAFDVGKLGTDRVGFYAMVGEAPTTF